ncbi:MAG: hypothetical protein JWP02_840 [Acidimicrobiales bacterium]|nr:hypothetical protein [Acidimicrobiales bacterium]
MHHVVTPARVAAAIKGVVGDRVEVGPLSAGPASAAKATMVATLAGVDVTPRRFGHGPLQFDAVVRLSCELHVRAPAIKKTYRGELTVPLRLEVHTASAVRLVIDVQAPPAEDIGVDLNAKDRSGRLIQQLGNIDGEVRSQAAAEVARRVEAPEARRHREIDILAMVDDVWQP